MKFLLCFIALGIFLACGLEEENAQHMFAIRKKAQATVTHHYAKYRFSLEGYEDVDIAVKVAVQSGQAKTLWVKDLTTTTTTLEEATLTASGTNNINFQGKSEGDVGGMYTGVLETGEHSEITGCCGEMTFVPTVASSLTFVGIKLESLTAAQWQEFIDNPAPPEEPSLMVAELGTQKIGTLFGIKGIDNVQRLEAHNSEGKVERALARWQTEAGADVFDVQSTDDLFLTAVAMSAGVTELIGFDAQGNKILKANLTVAAHDHDVVLTSSYFERGSYTWVAFSTNPNPDPADPNYILGEDKNAYISFDSSMKIHDYHTGFNSFAGVDSRGYWVGIYGFECLVDNKLMARVLNKIYTGTCLAEGS